MLDGQLDLALDHQCGGLAGMIKLREPQLTKVENTSRKPLFVVS